MNIIHTGSLPEVRESLLKPHSLAQTLTSLREEERVTYPGQPTATKRQVPAACRLSNVEGASGYLTACSSRFQGGCSGRDLPVAVVSTVTRAHFSTHTARALLSSEPCNLGRYTTLRHVGTLKYSTGSYVRAPIQTGATNTASAHFTWRRCTATSTVYAGFCVAAPTYTPSIRMGTAHSIS